MKWIEMESEQIRRGLGRALSVSSSLHEPYLVRDIHLFLRPVAEMRLIGNFLRRILR
jgi:hypothetical protein